MDGFSSHTFSLVNDKNELFYVKVATSKRNKESRISTPNRANEMRGIDPDYAQRVFVQRHQGRQLPEVDCFRADHAGK